TSMDELPQLLNVLLGEMSLVGPRPPIPHQMEDYGEAFVFSQARPGITGLWQVSGRNEINFEGRIGLESYYVENWSFWLDVRILLKTVVVVFRGSGAY
ncbi:MAG: Undecaprenyl-phosphate galactose phosphotransferase, WbaP, partial [Thermoleophilia bacterium]|nr:Undecaprenyl-phosphate galactose phosphotransferase, WbaP [Thermoleophilia bacterium]